MLYTIIVGTLGTLTGILLLIVPTLNYAPLLHISGPVATYGPASCADKLRKFLATMTR